MDYEMAMKVENGEMPEDYYRIAHDERELAAIIEDWHGGGTIAKDTKAGYGFYFGQTESGKWFFATEEFLDDDEEQDNPDYHEGRYETAIEGVRDFKINGKLLIEAVRGCRIAQNDGDVPIIFPD